MAVFERRLDALCASGVGALEVKEHIKKHYEVWLSLARAPGLGPGGRRFESCHPDLEININMRVWFNGRTSAFQAEYVGSIPITRFLFSKLYQYVSVAQLDRATAF